MKSSMIISCIAVLISAAVLLSGCGTAGPGPVVLDGDGMERTAYPLSEPHYPDMAPFPTETEDSDAYEKWRGDIQAQHRDLSFSSELNEFYGKIIPAFLSSDDGENRIISPLNLYMALSMLAEITDGGARAEIMELINCPDVDALRKRASDLWNSHFRRDGATSLTLANSIWLRSGIEYNADCLQTLSENYYASSFAGIMGSGEYDSLLRSWINEQTDYLLSDFTPEESLEPDTVLALVSAVCFRAKWADEFNADNTLPDVFHGSDGEAETDFMHTSLDDRYWRGENFGAVMLGLDNGAGTMELILPDEDSDIESILYDEEFCSFMEQGRDWINSSFVTIDLAMPKFDIEADAHLKEGFKALGVSRVFTDTADFSPVSGEEGIYVSDIHHAARAAADEKGIKAAAYTVILAPAACEPPEEHVEFILDRPFIFMIRSSAGQPVIAAAVNSL